MKADSDLIEKSLQIFMSLKNTSQQLADLSYYDFIVNFKETIEITGNPIVVSLFMGILKKAHLQLNKNIKVNLKA